MDGTGGAAVRLTLGQLLGRSAGLLLMTLDQECKRIARAKAAGGAGVGAGGEGEGEEGAGVVVGAASGLQEAVAVEEALAKAKMSVETVGWCFRKRGLWFWWELWMQVAPDLTALLPHHNNPPSPAPHPPAPSPQNNN